MGNTFFSFDPRQSNQRQRPEIFFALVLREGKKEENLSSCTLSQPFDCAGQRNQNENFTCSQLYLHRHTLLDLQILNINVTFTQSRQFSFIFPLVCRFMAKRVGCRPSRQQENQRKLLDLIQHVDYCVGEYFVGFTSSARVFLVLN